MTAVVGEPICVRYTYPDGLVEARRDYRTNWVKKSNGMRPILAEVFGLVTPSDWAAIRNVVCPRRGKVRRYDDKGEIL